MKTTKKKSFFHQHLGVCILVVAGGVCSALAAVNISQKLDSRLYDILLGLPGDIGSSDSILLIDIEDKSLAEYGTWPWTRDILADVLIRMRELGAYNAVFDIEYLTPSSVTVDEHITDIAQSAFMEGEESISAVLHDFSGYIASGDIPPEYAQEASGELMENSIDPVIYGMYDRISRGLNRDNDDYFARAIQFFGNTYLTINMGDVQISVSDEDASYIYDRFLLSNVQDGQNLIDWGNDRSAAEGGLERGFGPAIRSFLSHAQGAGFTNVVLDRDGTRRRVELLNNYQGRFVGQLAVSPLLRQLDVRSLERTKRALVLHDALLPGKDARTDITIPLDGYGRMFINWLKESYGDSFSHVPVFNFKYLDDNERNVYQGLCRLQSADLSALPEEERDYVRNVDYLVQEYGEVLEMRGAMLARCNGYDAAGNAEGGGLSGEDYDAYYALRQDYVGNVTAFVQSLLATEAIRAAGVVPPELADAIAAYNENFAALRELVQGAFCIIGNSATGSTDLGVTPFHRGYANLGTHANVANTILQQKFIHVYEVWYGLAFAFACALLGILLTRKMGPGTRTVWGLLYVVVPIGTMVALMGVGRIYVPLVMPSLLVIATYLAELARGFILTERDKHTLRRGFDAYVAPDVVSEIVKNPSLLGLGGVNKHMTALFSDVRTFSGFTECINQEEGEQHGAVRLVEILNGYLGMLSDAIMAQRGTIDKYVGDEIVSFFGAPLDNPNHAFDACVAGIRMKQAEDRYNAEHLAELPIHPVTKTPFLLRSRVGVNTGDMVVGNMGTDKKLNYTIMGNNVNLASRLEGTNKAYDSWIMASESTWLEADSGQHRGLLVAKQLDCVKVINVEKPVQIFSIQGLRSELPPEQVECAEIFNKGMQWYLRGCKTPYEKKDMDDFKKAIYFFHQAYQCYHTADPQDKNYLSTERKMIDRCQKFLAHGLPLDAQGRPFWNGVYTMQSK